MLRARVVWTSPVGGPYLSTFHFNPVIDTQLEADAAATATATFLNAIDSAIDSNVSWALQTQMGVVDPATGTQTGVFVVAGASSNGTSTGDMLPAVAQGLIRWNTGAVANGRVVRGKTFVPGIGENQLSEGRLAASVISQFLTAAQAFADGSTLGVWHRPTGDPPSGGSVHTVTTAAVWQEFASLTSRRD